MSEYFTKYITREDAIRAIHTLVDSCDNDQLEDILFEIYGRNRVERYSITWGEDAEEFEW